MKNTFLRERTRIALLILVVALISTFVFTLRKAAAPTEPDELPDVTVFTVPSCAGLSGSVPDGFTEQLDQRHCIRYAYPDVLGAPSSATPLSLHRLDPDDLSTYVAITIADETGGGGCHVTSAAYGTTCISPEDIRATYTPVERARNASYVGPAIRTRCDAGVDCVVVEGHVMTDSGRWLTLSAYIAETTYDNGMDAQLLDIIRSMDAQ